MAIIYRFTCSNDLCVGCCLISLFTEKLTKINRYYYHCMPGFDLPGFDLVYFGGWVYHNEYILCEIIRICFMPSVVLHNLIIISIIKVTLQVKATAKRSRN